MGRHAGGRSAGGVWPYARRRRSGRVWAPREVVLPAFTGTRWGGGGSAWAPHAPLGEQRAWAFGDPDATAGAAASQAGPV